MKLLIVDRWPFIGRCSACGEGRAVYRVELHRDGGAIWRGQVCRYCGSGMRLTLQLLAVSTTVPSGDIATVDTAAAVTVGNRDEH